jgi:hypothetical protein
MNSLLATLRNNWLWLATVPLIIFLVIRGIWSSFGATEVFDSLTWWPLLIAAIGIGIKYIFGADRLGLSVLLIGLVAFAAITIFGMSPADTVALIGELWSWLQQFRNQQEFPSIPSVIAIGIGGMVLVYALVAVAKGGGPWPRRIGGTIAGMGLIYLGAGAMFGFDRVDRSIAYIATTTQLPGETGAGNQARSVREVHDPRPARVGDHGVLFTLDDLGRTAFSSCPSVAPEGSFQQWINLQSRNGGLRSNLPTNLFFHRQEGGRFIISFDQKLLEGPQGGNAQVWVAQCRG